MEPPSGITLFAVDPSQSTPETRLAWGATFTIPAFVLSKSLKNYNFVLQGLYSYIAKSTFWDFEIRSWLRLWFTASNFVRAICKNSCVRNKIGVRGLKSWPSIFEKISKENWSSDFWQFSVHFCSLARFRCNRDFNFETTGSDFSDRLKWIYHKLFHMNVTHFYTVR